MKQIYFDNNATTRMREEVVAAMSPYFRDVFGNPSSIHSFGQSAKKALEDARENVARLINAKKPSEVIFTSSGTESINTAIKGVAFANKEFGNHIITTAIEHHAVLHTCQYLEKEHGFEVTYLPVDRYGMVSLDELKKAIKETTIIVSVMHANNEIGTIQPIAEIGKIISEINKQRATDHKFRIYFHTDAVQTVGKLPIDVEKLKVDFLSFSGHKFYGPRGVGCLYVRDGSNFHPLLHGGHHERNRRASTENLAGIVGLSKALELAVSEMAEENEKLSKLRDRLQSGIFEKISYVRLNGHETQRLSGTLNIGFDFVDGESLVIALDMAGVAVSTGSACASGSTKPSHVISAIGCPPELARGSVRFSLGIYNTQEEVDYVIEILPGIVEKLRKISPLYSTSAL